MYEISFDEVNMIAGGVDNAEANQRIGNALGTAFHALTSTEAIIGSVAGVSGAIIGAIIHMNNKH